MKKLWVVISFLLVGAVVVYAGWDIYSALTAPAAGDLILVQDISDTGDSAAGTTKRMTIDDLFDYVGRDISAQSYTNGETQTTVTGAHMIGSRYLTDQGGSAETDLILTDIEYYIDCIVKDTEGNGYEICPPSGETLYPEGDASGMTADHCIDHTGAVGDWAVLSRTQIADGTWVYALYTGKGSWIDGNDTGD